VKRSSEENLLCQSDLPVPATKKGRNDTDYRFGIETDHSADSAPLISLSFCVEQTHLPCHDSPSSSSNASRVDDITSILQKFHIGKASCEWLNQWSSDDTESGKCAVRSTENASLAEEKHKDEDQAFSSPKARKSVRFADDVQVIAIEPSKSLDKKVKRGRRAKAADYEGKSASDTVDADVDSLAEEIHPAVLETLLKVKHTPQGSSRLLTGTLSCSRSDGQLLSGPMDHPISSSIEAAKQIAVENDHRSLDPVTASQHPERCERPYSECHEQSQSATSENQDNVVKSRAARDRTCVTASADGKVTDIRNPPRRSADSAEGGNHGSRARMARQSSSRARLQYGSKKQSIKKSLRTSSETHEQVSGLESGEGTEILASHDVFRGDEQAEHINVDSATSHHPGPRDRMVTVALSLSPSSTSQSAPDDSRADNIEKSSSQSKPKTRFHDAHGRPIEAARDEEYQSLSDADEYKVNVPGAFDTTTLETPAERVEPAIPSRLGLMERTWTALSKFVSFGPQVGSLT
jgi:hypothetical protein